MGLGFSRVESLEPKIDDTIIKSRRRAKMGSQFENWSIEDVQETLGRFECYKKFKFKGLESTRTKLLTQWPEFYEVMEFMSRKKAREALMAQRDAMHPGCRRYAMERDPESRFPPPLPSARSEVGGDDRTSVEREDDDEDGSYNDISDDASETAGGTGSADELSSNLSDDSDEDAEADGTNGSSKSKKKKKKKEKSEGEDEEKGSVESGSDAESSGAGSGSGSESDVSDDISDAPFEEMEADLEAEIRAKYNDTSPLRPDWDIRTRNPIFFGYQTTSVAEVDAKELAQREAEKKAEKEDAKNAQSEELDELLEEIKVEMDGINGRREARRKKREKELAGRERTRKRREKELEEARKMYDDGEFRSYEVTWQAEEDGILDNEAVADAKYEIKAEEQDAKWDKIELQLERKEKALREETRLLASRPRGEKFVRRSRRKMEKLQVDLGRHKRELQEAERDLKLTEEELLRQEADPKTKPGTLNLQRSLKIAAETKLEHAQKHLTETIDAIDAMAARLQRAQRLKAREDRFIPVYSSLVDTRSSAGDLNVLDATLLVAMNSQATVEQKVLFGFNAFDFFKRRALGFDAVVALVSTVVRTLERVGDAIGASEEDIEAERLRNGAPGDEMKSNKRTAAIDPRPKMGDGEVDNMVMRAFIEMDVPFSKALTIHDFTKWATTLIERVEDLADAFRVNWRFSMLSDFERDGMAPVHKFRQGMITLPQLQYLWAKRALKFRTSLALKQRRLMHERAMSMGEDDPTKPDYSKYMPKAKGQYFDTKMRPLRHKRLHNKQWYVQQIETFWATRIQSAYRALAGRRAADVEAKRQAFYAAKELARADAETKVRAEYDVLENLTAGSTKRLKWDAKVRMQQVKLRTKGLSLNREECVRYMVDKNVDKALRKVEKGFQTMEKESGFSMTDREKRLQHEADKMRLQYLTSLKDTGKPGANADGDDGGSDQNGTSGGDAGAAKFEEISGQAKRKMLRDAEINRQRERRRSLVLCDFDQRPELFDVGETSKERKLRILLAHPNPTQGALLKHLCSMHRDFTKKRVLEMLQELPSKRLLLQYVMRFRDARALGWHLHDHFSFLNRDTEGMAQALINLSRADFQLGRVEGRVRMLLDEHQHSLHRVAALDADEAKAALDKVDKRRVGQLQAEMNRKKVHVRKKDEDSDDQSDKDSEDDSVSTADLGPASQEEVQLDLLVEKDEEELGEAEKALDDVRRELAAAQARTAEAIHAVARLKKRLQDREHIASISRQDRTAWNRRLAHCIDLPETNDTEVYAKYSEMAALFHDFKHCATSYAETIVNELFMSHDEKSLKPVGWEEIDQLNIEKTMLQRPRGLVTHDAMKKRPKWVVSNIRFKVARDEHGLYNGDTDSAAKAFGADLRHSIAYLKCYVPGVIVPMMCMVDFRGFRVQCTAVVPLEVTKVDEMGEVRSRSEMLVMGSRDRGEHVFNDDSDFREKMASACQRLNLAAHAVKGSEDLIAKTLQVGCDVRGYIGADGRRYLINFRRAFPPEHPKCTPHLRPEPRDMSIMWRFLRPQLVKRNPSPLSADALALYTADMADAEQHDRNVEAATRRLVEELIPEYASDISRRSKDRIGKMDVTFEMHRLGMNLRHLGLLRGHFWFRLPGLVALDFNSRYVKTTMDTTADIDIGSKILVQVPHSAENESKGETAHQRKQRLKKAARKAANEHKKLNSKQDSKAGSQSAGEGSMQLVQHSGSASGQNSLIVPELEDLEDVREEDEDLEEEDPSTYTEELYALSLKQKDRFSSKYLTMTAKVDRISVRGCKAMTGIVQERSNSKWVRDKLLLEIVLRSLKGLWRMYLRGTTRIYGVTSEQPLRVVCMQFLNMVTGSHPRSEDMWNEEVLVQIEARFGIRALSTIEKHNISRYARRVNFPRGAWPKTVLRLCEMMGVVIAPPCAEKFLKEPRLFKFSLSDLVRVGPRIKHNLNLLDFSEAQLLSVRARNAQSLTYPQTLKVGKGGGPLLHLRLSERLASRIAFNLGSGGMGMSGYYSRTIVFEVETPIQNDFPRRGVRFDAGRQARVDVKYHKELSPFDPKQPFSVSCWARLLPPPQPDPSILGDAAAMAAFAASTASKNSGGEGTKRVLCQTGRWTLALTKDDVLVFAVFCVEWGTEVVIAGPKFDSSSGRWNHVCGTFDGAVARLYVNGWECGSADVQERALKDTLGEAEARKEAGLKMDADEHRAKEEAMALARDHCLTWLNEDKQGKRYLQSRIRNAIEKSIFKLKMTKNAEELGLRKLSKKEATKLATKEVQEEKAEQAAVEVANEFVRRREEQSTIYQKMQEENQRREYWPVRIGSGCPTARQKAGGNWFIGEMCHVAIWGTCLPKQRVVEQFTCGTRDQSSEATRLFDLAALKFESALAFSYDDENVLNRYAETLCQHAGYGASAGSAEDLAAGMADYFAKVRKAIAMFRRTENCDGVRALMGKLPQDETYADLLCESFRAIEDMDPDYLRDFVDFIAPLPAAFSLVELRPEYVGRIPNQRNRVDVAADIYKIVVSERPNYFSRLIDMKWLSLPNVQTSSLIVYIVNEVRQGADLRRVDLSRAHDCSPDEIAVFSDHVRDVYSLCLKRCSLLDSTISLVGQRCRYLRELDLTGCAALTDAACENLGKSCKDLQRLSIAGCGKITDEGVSDIARAMGGSLTALNLNRCQFICDESLTAIGESCQKLTELHLSWMQQITDRGIYTFASYANVDIFHTLDLSACRKIADDGVIGVAERLTNLTDLSVYYCNKITDRGALAITHNLYKLKKLVVADLYQITDTCLHFDRDGDGRPVIDANMLKSIEKFDLTDCNRLTDFGFASLVTRCVSLRELVLAGCVGLSDKALEMIRTNPIHSPTYATESKTAGQLEDAGVGSSVDVESGSTALTVSSAATTPSKKGSKVPRYPAIIPNWVRFDRLDTLNIAYCANFTDRGVESISATCKALTSINISGCTRMTDEALRLLCTCCPCISHIEMAYCHNMTDASLHYMAQELWVESLNVGHCTRIGDEGIMTLVGRCNGIHKLRVPWCRKITDRSMNQLATECKHVELLDISAISSDSISDSVLARVKETNPTIKIVKDSHLQKKDAEALAIESASGGPETLEDL